MTVDSSAPPSRRLLGFLAAVGVLLSAWLWVVHIRTYLSPGSSSGCSFDAKLDCVQVAASSYSVFLGVPWAAFGLVGFLALSGLIYQRSILALPLSLVISAGSVGLLWIEVARVGSICLWCEAVHGVAWVLTALLLRERRSLIRDETNPVTLQIGVILPVALLLTLWAFLPRYWGAMSYKAQPPFPTGLTADGHPWIGSANPTVTIHEFIDYRCPHCKVATTQTLRKLARASGVRIVRRHQPRTHCKAQGSCESLRLALCAGQQQKFWQADRYLFEMAAVQKDLDKTQMARELGLDESALRSCADSAETQAAAERQVQEASKLKIRNTPGYIVDGKRLKPEEAMALF